jgi:uncharacterized protein DUF3515
VSDSDLFSRRAVRIAVGLAGLLVVGVVVAANLVGSGAETPAGPTPTPSTPNTGPVPLVPVDAPDAGAPACANVINALPADLTSGSSTLHRLPIAEPAPPATMAWGDADTPVVLRCGLSKPPELTPTSELREISGVSWLPIPGDRATTWYLAKRAVYVALTVPAGAGTGVLQGVSETVGRTLGSA